MATDPAFMTANQRAALEIDLEREYDSRLNDKIAELHNDPVWISDLIHSFGLLEEIKSLCNPNVEDWQDVAWKIRKIAQLRTMAAAKNEIDYPTPEDVAEDQKDDLVFLRRQCD